MSCTTTYLINQTSTQNLIDALLDARAVVGASSLDPKPFAFTNLFMLTEQVNLPLKLNGATARWLPSYDLT